MKHDYSWGSRLVEVMTTISHKDCNDISDCLNGIKSQNINKAYNNKIKRTGFTLDEFLKIADACGFSIILSKNNTKILVEDIERGNNGKTI